MIIENWIGENTYIFIKLLKLLKFEVLFCLDKCFNISKNGSNLLDSKV